jgi:diphthamide synthase (EF-2-diphthine--ammonia ligase)
VDAWKAFVDGQFHQEATPREDLVYKMAEEIKLYKLKIVAERTAREHAEALWKQDQEAKRQAERESLERLRTINDDAMRLKKENERLKALLADSEGVVVGLRGEKADEEAEKEALRAQLERTERQVEETIRGLMQA